jgi:hypothetical protein
MKTAAFLAKDAEGQDAVTLLVKLAYALEPNGGLAPAADPVDFTAEDELEAKGDEPGYFPVAECELVPFKLRTDVVVTGTIRTSDAYPRRDVLAGIRVGHFGKAVQVFGDRRIEADGAGLRFSEPEPFSEMPLTYTRAYGGVDPSVPRKEDPQTALEWMEYLTLERHPGVYPRNPVGMAYVVNDHKWLVLERPLPNFEDPEDLLTPERIVVGDARLWWRQPLPAGLGWFGRNWYPRSVMGGLAASRRRAGAAARGGAQDRAPRSRRSRRRPRSGSAAAPRVLQRRLTGARGAAAEGGRADLARGPRRRRRAPLPAPRRRSRGDHDLPGEAAGGADPSAHGLDPQGRGSGDPGLERPGAAAAEAAAHAPHPGSS